MTRALRLVRPRIEGRHAAIALVAVASVALQALLVYWYIEDAAISFSYARNWAMGEGLVSWPGGERCEGYSNPTWVGLMAAFHLVGVDGFASSKAMGFVFGALTVPVVAAIAGRVRPDRPTLPVYAAALLALNTQFTIWNASGLENSLLNLGLALGAWRALVEQEKGRWPLSPLAWLVVALTRPEGIAYAAVGGFWQMAWSLADGRGLGPTLRWLAVFWAPWAVYNAVRYEYFAWWFPNTYYAKEDAGDFQPWSFQIKGWKYIRGWAFDLGQAYWTPVYLAGLLSLSRWRGAAAVLMSAWLAFVLLPGSQVLAVKPLGDTVHKQVWRVVNTPGTLAVLVGAAALAGAAAGVVAWRKGRGTALDPVLSGARAAALAALPIGAFYAQAKVSALGVPPDKVMWTGANVVLLVPAVLAAIGGLGSVALRRAVTPAARVLLTVAVAALVARGALEIGAAATVAKWPTWKLNWNGVRVGSIFAIALLAPLFAIGRPGWRGLVLCWQLAVFAMFFALWSGGDWMKQYRWMASLTVPASVLLAVGLAELQDLAQWRWGRRRETWGGVAHGLGFAALVAFAVPNVHNLTRFATKPETGPFSVKNRVEYMQGVGRRLHLDEPIVAIDVDQGAHLWWSGFQMLDLAGLVDVPMAHHEFQKPFIREYLFQEMRPHFAHVHGGWANTSKMGQHPEWKEQYFEIPGYAGSQKAKTLHIGNHIRKDLLASPTWTGTPGRRVAFEDDVVLEGFEVPSDVAGQGMYLFAEIALSSKRDREITDTFRVTMFLADAAGNVLSWDAAPGLDWLEVGDWKPGEVVRARYSFPIPARATAGAYNVGFVVTGEDGHVLRPIAEPLPAGAVAGGIDEGAAPRFAIGEVRFPVSVEVVAKDVVAAHTADDLAALAVAAGAGRCEDAEAALLLAKRRNTWDADWYDATLVGAGPELARCWAGRVAGAPREAQVHAIRRARRWDHREPVVLEVARGLADAWFAEGLAAQGAKDWEVAYRAFSDALVADPQRSWARRYAEEARDHRLGLDAPAKNSEPKTRLPRRPALLPNGLQAPDLEDEPAGPEGDEGPRGPEAEE